MSHSTLAEPPADQNLLFGVLALQLNLVGRDELLAAMRAWAAERQRPLAEILVARQALAADVRGPLEALAAAHARRHGDARRSLAALDAAESAVATLRRSDDAVVRASLDLTGGTPSAPETRAAAPSGGAASAGVPRAGAPRYRVVRPHARGGLGEVFVAHDEELNREVALKEIRACFADDAARRGRFLLEAEITGRLEHPGVVPVYGLGAYADGRPFYAMRFIEGEDLRSAVARFHAADGPERDPGERRLAFRELLGRFVAVCQAVAFAHSRGVLHRDLKPANIMLGKYGETLVVDWGLAKAVGRRDGEGGTIPLAPRTVDDGAVTQVGSALGTPAYMSPEQAAGELDRLGPASDVYGLGATLYTVLTGKAPVEGSDLDAVMERVRRGEVPPPRRANPIVPPALDAVCRKAMTLAPADRYASALDLAADVGAWLADEPVTAWREPRAMRARRWVRRHRTLVTGAAAALLVGAVSLGVAAVLLARAKGLAERQRDRARDHFQLAREAVDRFHTAVSQSEEMKAKGVEQLRTRLLREAADFYERFARDEEAGGAEVEAERGRALRRLADLLEAVGDHTEAEKRYRESEAVFRRPTAAGDAAPDRQRDLAATLNNMGAFYFDLGRRAEAEAALREAIDLRRPLADNGGGAEARRDLAGSLSNLGNLYAREGRVSEAEAAYQESIGIGRGLPAAPADQQALASSLHNLGLMYARVNRLEEARTAHEEAGALGRRLVDEEAGVPARQNHFANNRWALGYTYAQLGRSADAAACYAEAVNGYRRLADGHPTVSEYARNLAGSLADLADLMSESGRPVEALPLYDEAARRLDALLAAEPRLVQAQRLRSLAITGRAAALDRLGRRAEAVATWERAAVAWAGTADLVEGPGKSWYRLQEAQALGHAGRALPAATVAETVVAEGASQAGFFYDAACALALASAAASRSAALPPHSAGPLALHFAARSVAVLRQSVRAGYKDANHVKTDHDFDALRGRADFRALLAEVEAKK